MLHNIYSEVRGSYAEKHINCLDVIDHMILKTVLGAQAKVTVETLYQETGAMSVKHVIAVRRMLYLKTILDREDHEITKKVYYAMKKKPYKGDWYNLVKADFEKNGIEINEDIIKETNRDTFKKLIKTNVWNAFFKELEQNKLSHIKVKEIKYSGLRSPMKYLTDPSFDNSMRSLLLNLRSKSANSFQDSFHRKYGKEPPCKMCRKSIDSQEHSLTCIRIKQELSSSDKELLNSVKYSDMFGSVSQQFMVTKMFQRILEIQESLGGNSFKMAYPGTKFGT